MHKKPFFFFFFFFFLLRISIHLLNVYFKHRVYLSNKKKKIIHIYIYNNNKKIIRKAMESMERKRKNIWETTLSEFRFSIEELRKSKFNFGLVFAIFCVLLVIVGNVVLLIAVNFWLSLFPKHETFSNSGQIAAQVIASVFLVFFFSFFGVGYIAVWGFRPLLHVLIDTNRMQGPLCRLMLLFASGTTNALSGVLAIYAMPHTPEFIQAVLLSAIPFCAQAWTYILLSNERKRRYFSLTLIASFIFFVAGVLLSSMSSLLHASSSGKVVPWSWVLVYLSSAVVFGLWCVVQRLYLDAVMFSDEHVALSEQQEEEAAAAAEGAIFDGKKYSGVSFMRSVAEGQQEGKPAFARRQWGKQSRDDLAAKTVLLLAGVLFQAIVSFACLPVDAIPWFGTTSSIADSFAVFCDSCAFIFHSWHNVRFGLLHAFGLVLSFVGCAYLNERSPTLASVVLQLAAPVTGLVLIIAPDWDVYGEHGVVGHKVGGVILLVIAGLAYHVWDQATLHEMLEKHNEPTSNDERDKTEGKVTI